MGAPGDTVLLK